MRFPPSRECEFPYLIKKNKIKFHYFVKHWIIQVIFMDEVD